MFKLTLILMLFWIQVVAAQQTFNAGCDLRSVSNALKGASSEMLIIRKANEVSTSMYNRGGIVTANIQKAIYMLDKCVSNIPLKEANVIRKTPLIEAPLFPSFLELGSVVEILDETPVKFYNKYTNETTNAYHVRVLYNSETKFFRRIDEGNEGYISIQDLQLPTGSFLEN